MAQKTHKVGKLNSSIDIIPLQGTSDSVIRMGNPSDFHCPRDPRIPRDPLIFSRVQTKRYCNYHAKKRSAFRAMVRPAYDEITESFGRRSDGSMDEDDDKVEVKMIKFYKKKRDGQNRSTSDKELINISSDEEGDKHSVDGGKKHRELLEANKSDFDSSSNLNVPKAAPRKVSEDMPAPESSLECKTASSSSPLRSGESIIALTNGTLSTQE